MDEKIKTKLDQIADEYERDFSAVEELYEKELERIKETDTIGIEENEYEYYAAMGAKSNLQRQKRTAGVSGEAEELPIAAIGNFGVFDSWGQNNDTVMVGVGLVAPPDTEDENRPAGVAAFIMNESLGVDVGKARDLWQWGQHLRGWFSVERLTESFAGRSRTYYICGSTDRSKVEEADFEGDLPKDPSKFRELLAEKFVPEAFTLETIGDNLSAQGEEFGSNWLDLRRFEGQVVDAFRRLPEECDPSEDENPFGKYTLVDDTVASHEELTNNRELVTEEDVQNGRAAGLQVFLPPEAVQYGEDSTVEVYGTLRRNEETGQITMDGAGVAPLIPRPYEEEEGGDHEDVEEETL